MVAFFLTKRCHHTIIQQQKLYITKCIDVVKGLLKDMSSIERREARERSMRNRLRLGHFITHRSGGTLTEKWTMGSEFLELGRRRDAIAMERAEIERQQKRLLKLQPADFECACKNNSNNGSHQQYNQQQQQQPEDCELNELTDQLAGNACNPTVGPGSTGHFGSNGFGIYDAGNFCKFVTFRKPDRPASVPCTPQEYHELSEILELRKNALKKEDGELLVELDQLVRERYLHLRELKRINNEDDSRFNNHPVLNDRYLLLILLGKGGYSEVYKAFDLKDQRYVACKVHELNNNWTEFKKAHYFRHALREYNIHNAIDHSRVVKLYEVFEIDANSFCTVMEYCEGPDLSFYLKQHKLLSERESRSIVLQIVSALTYMNKLRPPVIHYDLKPGNILLSDRNVTREIKLTDFGLSKVMDDESFNPDCGMDLTTQGVGTLWYLPPECFVVGENPPKICSKVDVWSLGVIFYQCLYGKKPYAHNQTPAVIIKEKLILNAGEVEFPNNPKVSDQAKDFIRCCLTYCKEDRMDVLDLAQHDYLQPRMSSEEQEQEQEQQRQS